VLVRIAPSNSTLAVGMATASLHEQNWFWFFRALTPLTKALADEYLIEPYVGTRMLVSRRPPTFNDSLTFAL
jgi:hypothetical protein